MSDLTPITDTEKKAVDITLLKVAAWIDSRKLDLSSSCLTYGASMGFNLACDFLAHELRKIRESTNWDKDKNEYKTASEFHKEVKQ